MARGTSYVPIATPTRLSSVGVKICRGGPCVAVRSMSFAPNVSTRTEQPRDLRSAVTAARPYRRALLCSPTAHCTWNLRRPSPSSRPGNSWCSTTKLERKSSHPASSSHEAPRDCAFGPARPDCTGECPHGRQDDPPFRWRAAVAQFRSADACGPAGQDRARRFLGLHLRQLLAHPAV